LSTACVHFSSRLLTAGTNPTAMQRLCRKNETQQDVHLAHDGERVVASVGIGSTCVSVVRSLSIPAS
jgi:hypothetical protein